MQKKKGNRLFLLTLFVVGFLATFSYGAYLDQDSEQQILFSNIKEYLSRLPFRLQIEQELSDAGIIEISASVDRDHGIATYYPVFPIWYVNKLSTYWGNIIWHVYTYCFVYWVGYYSLYMLLRKLFMSRKVAIFTVMVAFLTPRMFAECHYNNKDMILYALLYALFYWGYCLIEQCTIKNAVIFAVYGALAFNTKIVGAWFFGIIGIYVLAYFIAKKKFNKKILSSTVICIGVWISTYIFITPACWNNIADFFQYLFLYAVDFERWHNYILFNGKLIHKEYTGIPHKYLPTMMIYTIPTGILLLTIWGYIICAFDCIRNRFRQFFQIQGYIAVIIFSSMIPLAYAILTATPVYNGWRHFYFVYASMIMAIGYGVYRLFFLCNIKFLGKIMCYGGVVYICTLTITLLINHPQEHSYYNWLAGDSIEEYFELDYWDMSTWQAYKLIVQDAKEEKIISVGALNLPTLWGMEVNFEILPQDIQYRIKIEREWEQADYLIVNTTYANIYNKELYKEIKEKYVLMDQICSYGNTVCEIYKGVRDNVVR